MPKLFALDHNFPLPIVHVLNTYTAEAELVPLQDIDSRLPEFEDDWRILLALHHDSRPWDGMITTDSSMVQLPRELATLIQTKLTLVVALDAGHDPLKATGLLFAYLPGSASGPDRTMRSSGSCGPPIVRQLPRGISFSRWRTIRIGRLNSFTTRRNSRPRNCQPIRWSSWFHSCFTRTAQASSVSAREDARATVPLMNAAAQTVSCIKCGRVDEPAGALLKDRQPCKDCGSLNRQVGLMFVSNSTSSSTFSLNVIRGMNPARDRAFQVLLAFALAAAVFALTGFFWQAVGVALAGVSVACYWPQLEPRIAALMPWVTRQ